MLQKQSVRRMDSCSSRVTTTTTITSASIEKASEVKRHTSLKEPLSCKEKFSPKFHDDQSNDQTDYINYQLIHESGINEETREETQVCNK